MQLAFSNSSINTPREILRDNTYFYVREHRKLFVFTWCRIFPRIALMLCNRESFPANNKKGMQPRKFSTANDLHYTVYRLSNPTMVEIGTTNPKYQPL